MIFGYGFGMEIEKVPSANPMAPPTVAQVITKGKMRIRRTKMKTLAIVIPADWIINPKVRASSEGILRTLV